MTNPLDGRRELELEGYASATDDAGNLLLLCKDRSPLGIGRFTVYANPIVLKGLFAQWLVAEAEAQAKGLGLEAADTRAVEPVRSDWRRPQ